ncbi:phosphoethanolamine transferase [Noviherbaspirillum aerium]|uniref:phosphoethanolamine transferase n=1 Tax=Noviherbaspirillum aerium TaxID=2588497 RepID=UPI00124F674B|nr:phosphoethanolamine transferase [Noviherbaspirillum aerium]
MRLPVVPRISKLFVLSSYLLVSATPFVPLLLGRDVTGWTQLLGMQVIAWMMLWAVFKRPACFHPLLLPAFIAIPLDLYLQAYYGQTLSAHHFAIIAETNPGEAMEFLGHRAWLAGLLVLIALAWWGGCWLLCLRSADLDWTDRSRQVLLTVFGLAGVLVLYGSLTGSSGQDARRVVRFDSSLVSSWELPALPSWATFSINAERFGRTRPLGLGVAAYEFWKERKHLAALSDSSRTFRFGAVQDEDSDTSRTVVMVIGESSRYDRWSLNGYERETNPLLKTEPNLVSLSDVVTAVSATRLSVPVLVSRKPARSSLKAGFSEKSFLSAFREAGYKTWWVSNQMSFGEFDTPVSVFAKEAHVVQFLNFGSYKKRSSYDEVLLNPLHAALRDPAPKKLIVLHTLGNHWNYSHRHPQAFDKWQPSLFDVENPVHTDPAMKTRLNNSYDNSILYTDWFLANVIGELKDTRQVAGMMYIADHGQTLYDGSCKLAFHGHNTQHEFHVPALVWYSDAYRRKHPEKVAGLLRNRHAKLATENVFHSLLDMADIRYPTERLEWSFFSPQLQRHKRYVDSYGWTDYDNATFKGDCREVIGRDKPLTQEK